MNKQELINTLTSTYFSVAAPELVTTKNGIKVYNIPVFKVTGDNIDQINVGFMVSAEGEPSEQAFWIGKPPETPRSQFLIDIEAFIQTRIDNGTVEAVFITETSVSHEIASFEAWRLVTNILKRFSGIMFRQSNGQIDFRLENT